MLEKIITPSKEVICHAKDIIDKKDINKYSKNLGLRDKWSA